MNLVDPTGHSWLSKTWRGAMRNSFATGLGLQALGGWSQGAYFLGQTERGRNVLAGELRTRNKGDGNKGDVHNLTT